VPGGKVVRIASSLHAGDGPLVNSALAIIASAMITGSSLFPPARGQAMRTMNIKESEKIQ
jgi:hypothetical protein